MYENYSRQSLPSKEYRELLGSAICVFNSNNQFIIENILRIDNKNQYNWYDLIEKTSGGLSKAIKETITKESGSDIARLFNELIQERNRIIHSFQITTKNNEQKLNTKNNNNEQWTIEKEELLEFIKKNGKLSCKLHELRGY